MARFYLNGEPVDEIPEEAKKIMSKNLTATVSRYFANHPEEYKAFLEDQKKNGRPVIYRNR